MSAPNDMILAAAEVEIEASAKEALPKISVIAYTGRIMRAAGWGDIAIDPAGLQTSGQVPLLADHNATVGSVVGHGQPAVADGRLHPPTPTVRPLAEAGAVLRDLLDRRLRGKAVLVP